MKFLGDNKITTPQECNCGQACKGGCSSNLLPEKDQLLVETLSIGAMGVNSAMEFLERRNMAVVTGADRTDIQLDLEASTPVLWPQLVWENLYHN